MPAQGVTPRRGDTPARIVDAAVELFNARGTADVSTNHIAAACEMSPGNLYYHFRNKGEIIRAAYERSVSEESDVWAVAEQAASREAMLPFLRSVLAVRARYPFLRLEMPELVTRDPELASHYRDVQAGRLPVYRMLVESWLDQPGRGLDAELVERVVDETWLVLGAWYAHLAASGMAPDDSSVEGGADLAADIIERARAGLEYPKGVTQGGGSPARPKKKGKKGKKHKKSKN